MAQIEFFLSGGIGNSDPDFALGGPKSNLPILAGLNNLFSDILSEEAEAGKVDHRCFYIMNTGSTLKNAAMYISDQNSSGSDVLVGIAYRSEVQRININNTITSGNIIFEFGSDSFTVVWPGNSSGFATAIKDGFASIGYPVDVKFTIPANFSTAYSITFEGEKGQRNLPLLKVRTNSLSGGGTLTITVTTKKIISGSPVNSTADEIGTELMVPAGVNFRTTGPTDRIFIGDLAQGDFVPVWAKRTTTAGTEYLETDYFTLRVLGGPF
jgi:hypothetical protein